MFWINSFSKYFSLFGFHSIVSAKFGGKRFRHLTFAIQIVLCIWCTLYAFRTFIAEKRSIDFLDALNFFIFYLTTAVAYWLILYDTCKNLSIQNAFWQRFDRINDKLSVQIDLNGWDFLGAFIAICVIDLILFVLTIIRILNNSSDYVFHYNFIIIFDQRMFFYLLYLNAVILQMRRILQIIKCQSIASSSIFEYYRFSSNNHVCEFSLPLIPSQIHRIQFGFGFNFFC